MKKCLMSLMILLFTILLASCASQPVSNDSVLGLKSLKLPVQILFSNHRNLELEPCGCSMVPIGGLHREWNYIEEVRKAFPSSLYFVSGTSFIPEVEMKTAKNKQYYQLKSQSLVDAYQLMKIDALSPSSEDLYWGKKQLTDWAQQAGTQLVSSNLYDKATGRPLFNPYLQFEREGTRILVLAVTMLAREDVPIDANIDVKDPLESIETVLKTSTQELNGKNAVVVLLSQLPDTQLLGIAERFPNLHFILGSDSSRDTGKSEQLTATTLWAAPAKRGRSVISLGLGKNTAKVIGLYNPKKAKEHLFSRAIYEENLKDVNHELETKLTKKQRVFLGNKQKNIQNFLKRSTTVPTESTEANTLYEIDEAILDSSYQKAESNVMDVLLERFKDKTRELALSEEENSGQH